MFNSVWARLQSFMVFLNTMNIKIFHSSILALIFSPTSESAPKQPMLLSRTKNCHLRQVVLRTSKWQFLVQERNMNRPKTDSELG